MDGREDMCCVFIISHIYHMHTHALIYIQYIQLAWRCFVCLWVLRSAPICSLCVCNLPQTGYSA